MEQGVIRGRDWNALLRAVLLIGLTAFLARLVATGQITGYIHPKFTWFTASAGVGFLLMAGGQLLRGIRGIVGDGAPLRGRLYLAIALVLCMGFLLQPHTFGADLAGKQGLNLTNRTVDAAAAAAASKAQAPTAGQPAVTQPPAPAQPQAPRESTAPAQTQPQTPPPAPPAQTTPAQPGSEPPAAQPQPSASVKPALKSKAQLTGNTAVITPQNFVDWMTELYGDYTPYVGKRVVIEGFTFYPPKTVGEEFAVTRLVVTCHVAHAAPDGLLAYVPGKARPDQDTWHRVEGVLEPYTFDGTKTVRIRIDKFTPIAQPTDPYIYP